MSLSESLRNFEKAEVTTSVSAELILLAAGVEDPSIYLLAGVFAGIGTAVFLIEQSVKILKQSLLTLRAKVGSPSS